MKEMAWVNGTVSPLAEAKVPLLDRGYLFGDGVYEVIRIYDGRPFALEEHLDRLNHSLAEINLSIELSMADLKSAILEFINNNGPGDGQVYLQITRGAAGRQHNFPAEAKATVIIYTAGVKPPDDGLRSSGIKVITRPDDRWAHCHIKSINLLPNVLAKEAAKQAGAFEALLIAKDGLVREGSSSNVFAVKNRALITPPADGNILAGVTRSICIRLALECDYQVHETAIKLEELLNAEEVFITGTIAEILAVKQIDERIVGKGEAGPVTKDIYRRFAQLIVRR